MGVQADRANCLCQLRCEPPVRFPGERRNCYRNQADADFGRGHAEKLQGNLNHRESTKVSMLGDTQAQKQHHRQLYVYVKKLEKVLCQVCNAHCVCVRVQVAS